MSEIATVVLGERNESQTLSFPKPLTFAIIALVVLELITPFFARADGVDASYHLHWLSEFSGLVLRGVWFPRWIPEAYSGFGAPSFYFYPPLAYYFSTAIRIITGLTDSTRVFELTGLFATVASFFSAILLFRSLGAFTRQACLGAFVYAFAPFRIAELYSRANLSTHVGYIFIPLIWAGLVWIFTRGGKGAAGILLLAAATSLLALTSIPLLLVTFTCCVVAGIVLRKKITLQRMKALAWAAGLTIALSAFHYASVLSFQRFANVGEVLVKQPEFFLSLIYHGTGIPATYHIGVVFAMVFGPFWIYWKHRDTDLTSRDRTIIRIAVAIVALVSFLELPRISVPIWRYVLPFPLIQGGWRFYSHFILFAATFVALATTNSLQRISKFILSVCVIAGFGPILLILFNLHLFGHFARNADVATEYLPIQSVSREKVVPVLRDHLDDPPALATFDANHFVRRTLVDGAYCPDSVRATTSELFDVKLSAPQSVIFHRFYWPAWHLYQGEQEIASTADSLGRAISSLPVGKYSIRWQLERTPLETAGFWISGFAWCGVIITSGIGLVRRRVRRTRATSPV